MRMVTVAATQMACTDDRAKCVGGQWVDARFAQAWYEENVGRDLKQVTLDRPSVRHGRHIVIRFSPGVLYAIKASGP